MDIMSMLKTVGPKMILNQMNTSNPMVGNLIQMARNNDETGIENFARNWFSEQGRDFDSEFQAFKKLF